jgi:hypothetical protein
MFPSEILFMKWFGVVEPVADALATTIDVQGV